MASLNPTGYCLCGCGRITPTATRTDAARGVAKGDHMKFCGIACSNRFRSGFSTMEARFWSKVDKRGPDECWPWLGHISYTGTGQFSLTKTKMCVPHRLAYELTVGPIPEGLTLDHLCHTRDTSCHLGNACPHRSCCNPSHLEPVTPRVNVLRGHTSPSAINARKTHCIRGHEFAGENLAIDGRRRRCRECSRLKSARRWAARRRSEAAA